MPYPWPSLGGFIFKKDEQAIFESDTYWLLAPGYSRQRPLGTDSEVITTLSIGSSERSFEVNLTPSRYKSLENMINSKVPFTDWTRPIPETRMVFISEVSIVQEVFSTRSMRQQLVGGTNGGGGTYNTERRFRARIVLVSQ